MTPATIPIREYLTIAEAVADSADFEPSFKGETFVTVTFRIPKASNVGPGVFRLEFLRPIYESRPGWSIGKSEEP